MGKFPLRRVVIAAALALGAPFASATVLTFDDLGTDGLAHKRAGQQLDFTWALVRDELAQRLRTSPGVAAVRDDVRRAVLAGELPAPLAADRLLAAYDGDAN